MRSSLVCYTDSMQTGFHHAIHRHRHDTRKAKLTGLAKLIDGSAYLMGMITVAVNVPQLISVWSKPDIGGVSIISWIGFLLGSVFWLCYGLIHKEKPIIVINGMLIAVQGLIVWGLAVR